MSRAIGGLEQAVDTLTKTWAQQDREATEGRRILHQKIDELKQAQTTTTARMEAVEKTLEKIQPAVSKFERQQHQAEGMKKLGAILWLGMGGLAGFAGYLFHELMLLWKSASPPH